jgi:hypothetical protein
VCKKWHEHSPETYQQIEESPLSYINQSLPSPHLHGNLSCVSDFSRRARNSDEIFFPSKNHFLLAFCPSNALFLSNSAAGKNSPGTDHNQTSLQQTAAFKPCFGFSKAFHVFKTKMTTNNNLLLF